MTDPRPIGVFDSGVGGLTVLREILRRSPRRVDDLPRRQRPRAVRRPPGRGGPGILDRVARRAGRRATSRPSSSPATPRPRSRSATCGAATTCRSSASSGPVRVGRGTGDAQPAGRRHRDAGDDPVARLLRGDQGREPGRRGLRARHADVRADGRGRAPERARGRGGRRARRSRRCSASATPRGEFVFPLPPSARIDTLLLGCTHYPLLRAAHRGGGRRAGSRSSIRRRRRRRRSPSCSSINGLEAPGGDGAGAPARPAHLQLTTGDVDAFRAIAERMFGERSPTSPAVELDGARVEPAPHDGRRARENAPAPVRHAAGAPTGAGRPASCSARRSAPRRPSSAGEPSASPAAGSSTGARSSGSRSAAPSRRRAGCRRSSCAPPTAPTARRWRASCRASARRSGTSLPGVVERATVVDRAGWVRANVGTFAALISRMEGELLDQVVPDGRRARRGRRWRSPTAG